jgi:tetratricopeptide (TPR) repeat protein
MDYAGADQRYAAAFAEAGLAREGDDPAEAAGRIDVSAVRGPLVAALDDWASCAQDDKRVAWLLAMARKADPDGWRDRARQPAVRQDLTTLQALLAEEEAADQSPQLVVALGECLARRGGGPASLRRAQVRHPDDFWLNMEMGYLPGSEDDLAQAAGYFRAALALRPDAAIVSYNLGLCLDAQGKRQEAEEVYRAAIRLDPKVALLHICQGHLLRDQGKWQEATDEYRAALRLAPKDAGARTGLGNCLIEQGKPQEAEAEYRAALRLAPEDYGARTGLGNALYGQGKRQEALAAYRAAIRLDPEVAPREHLVDAGAHNKLGDYLHGRGEWKGAEAEYRAATGLDPKFPRSHHNLGLVLEDQGRLKEAEEEQRAAIRLDAKYARPHNSLGYVLYAQGKRQEAEAEYRAAIRLDPKDALPHNNLANALKGQGRVEEAEEEHRAAIRLSPQFSFAHFGLGDLLKDSGRFEEARKEYQQAVALGYQAAAEGLRQCDRLIPLAARLSVVLRGDDHPAGAQEMLAFANLCSQPFERRLRAAVRFYGEAFAADPKLADGLKAGHRYNAACYAALAANGEGKDADKLDDKEKARLRRQALDWLRADLAAWAKRAQSHQPADLAEVQQTLLHWKEDTDLAGVRGDALAKLPEAERPPWKKLWDDVDALLAVVSAPETKR